MYEINACGNYPSNIQYDVTEVVDYLKENGYSEADFVLLHHFKTKKAFDFQMHPTTGSYGDWLIQHNILYDIVEDNTVEENVMYIYATNKGFPYTQRMENLKIITPDSMARINKITVVY